MLSCTRMPFYVKRVFKPQQRLTVILLFVLFTFGTCYEKTLRKIVRDQYKMVQKPFSASDASDMMWKNISRPHMQQESRPHAKGNTLYYSKLVPLIPANSTRHTMPSYFPDENKTHSDMRDHSVSADKNYPIPRSPPPTNNQITIQQKPIYEFRNFILPDDQNISQIDTDFEKKLQVSPINLDFNVTLLEHTPVPFLTTIDDKAEFIVEEMLPPEPTYSYNVSANSYFCPTLFETNAHIVTQERFLTLDIEPSWASKKTYWNDMFESRYESLMRNPKWPPLKVFLIPRIHVDSIWRKSFDQYHNNHVHKILTNVVKKMQFYKNLTFSWNEVSHLSRWWATTTLKNRSTFRRLVRSGRLEITNGFWVEPEEATTHIFALVHQLIEGHQWLKEHVNVIPKVGWLTNSVTHSPTIPYLLSASDVNFLVLTNLHFAWQKHLAEYQHSDFIWVQNWDTRDSFLPSELNKILLKIGPERLPKHSVLTHYLQFDSAGFKACGPQKIICATEFNFAKHTENTDINIYNVKEKAELLLEQYSKSGSITPHNVVIAPLGGPYRYESLTEFDYQFNNYNRLAEYINANKDVYEASVQFGTAADYFQTITKNHKAFPTLKGDFLNYADLENATPAYWTGFFTTRPLLKIFLRRLQFHLRTAEILFTFAASYGIFEDFNATEITRVLESARVSVARLTDRHVGGGTLAAHAMKHVHAEIVQATRDCWRIQETVASLLTSRPSHNTSYVTKYVYRDGELISLFRSITPGDHLYIFNSLSHERTEVVELITKNPNIRITNHLKKELTIQVNPVWKYGGGGADNIMISQRYYKIVFAILLPPLTFELFKVKETYSAIQQTASIFCSSCELEENSDTNFKPIFKIQPIESGDIQIENYKHRLIFDEASGFPKSIIDKDSNSEKTFLLSYGAFRSSDINSGMFLFNTNNTQPIDDSMVFEMGSHKHIIITSGLVTTEFSTSYGKLLQHTIRIFNLVNSPLSTAIYVESKVDFETSPKYREKELFMSLQTDISNGNPPQIITDNNGFQYTLRTLNISRSIESNMYPMTSMVMMQDRRSRITVVTDHAQGVASLHEGQLLVMLDRRVLFADGRGVPEGLADSRYTCHRHYLLLENYLQPLPVVVQFGTPNPPLVLPSLSAIYLSNALNYELDVFTIEKVNIHIAHHTLLPLVKSAFPCDVGVLTFRMLTHASVLLGAPASAALLVLHRQAFTCLLTSHMQVHCEGENSFSIQNILRNSKIVYKTNLCGTSLGNVINYLDKTNFGPMELVTLRIHF